jgi:hypothetical protein
VVVVKYSAVSQAMPPTTDVRRPLPVPFISAPSARAPSSWFLPTIPSRPRGHDGRGNLTVGPGDRFAPTAAVPRACFSRRDRGSPPANGLMGRTPLMVYGAKLVAAKWRRCSRRIGRWTAY